MNERLDLNDYPSPSRAIPWRRIGLIAGGIMAFLVVVVVTVRLWGSDTSSLSKDEAQTQEEMVEWCQSFPEEEQDNCLWEMARDRMDPTLCERISDEVWKRDCADGIYRTQALASGDVTFCALLSDAESATDCEATVSGVVTPQTCSLKGLSQEECQFLEVSEQAIVSFDREVCEQLEDTEQVFACKDLVFIDDADHDGLSRAQEMAVYSTDPRNADTDHDGYLDGEEVSSGYDPNGPGRLE